MTATAQKVAIDMNAYDPQTIYWEQSELTPASPEILAQLRDAMEIRCYSTAALRDGFSQAEAISAIFAPVPADN